MCRQEIRLTVFGDDYIEEGECKDLLLILHTAMQCDLKDTRRVQMGILIDSRLIARSSLVGGADCAKPLLLSDDLDTTVQQSITFSASEKYADYL